MSARAAGAPRAAALAGVLRIDPRLLQIAFLGVLLGAGVVARDFSLHAAQIVLCFAAGLATQAAWIRRLGLERAGYLSAIVTCFGLSVLLRADSLWVHPLAAMLCLSAKFVVRVNGKHLFNPTNLGVVFAVGLLPGAWISPGQWGSDLALACWVVVLGCLVAQRARRVDLSIVFLAVYLGLVGARVAWLGQSPAVLVHQLQSGALLVFAFFMISDPMTAPNRLSARLLHAGLVALGAFCWQYVLYIPSGPVWALFFLAPLVPVLDHLLPARRFAWRDANPAPARAGPGGSAAARST